MRKAMSIREGTQALRTQWSRGNGPVVDGRDIDYSYYSPVESGADSSEKYPLLIYMAGALEGQYEGKELEANNVADITAEEYQSRFTNGGAFIFIPRAPEEEALYWDQSKLIPALFAAIDDFVKKNPNVDTSKIINAGWCLGGTGAINLVKYRPEYFAGTIIMCPSRSITISEAQILANNSLWFISCKNDFYSNYLLFNFRSWLIMKKYTSDKANIRLSTYTDVPDTRLVPDVTFIKNHEVWSNVVKDMDPSGDFKGLKTIDGNGKHIPNCVSGWINAVTNKNSGGAPCNVGSAVKSMEKFYAYMNEDVKANARLRAFDVLTKIYKARGWL